MIPFLSIAIAIASLRALLWNFSLSKLNVIASVRTTGLLIITRSGLFLRFSKSIGATV